MWRARVFTLYPELFPGPEERRGDRRGKGEAVRAARSKEVGGSLRGAAAGPPGVGCRDRGEAGSEGASEVQ